MTHLDLKQFLVKLQKNHQILCEREAKYAAAAPLDLLNQIDDYERAIALTEQAMVADIAVDDLQADFAGLNLRLETVVFVGQEPPRRPFTGRNPYRGLRKFTEAEAEFFFGRSAAVDKLLAQLRAVLDPSAGPDRPNLLAVLGASGSGKSSLARAGLIPALVAGRLDGSAAWPVAVMLPGPHPLQALAELFVGRLGRGLRALRDELDRDEQALHFLMSEALAGQPAEVRFALVIDQFEEIFTLCQHDEERQAFLDQLLYACRGRGRRGLVVLTMRADFYSRVAAYRELAEAITQNQLLVTPLTERELREAILLPAEKVGLELEKDLVQALIHDTAAAPAALPLLQHALQELFHRRDGNLLTMAAYQEIGGIKGAIAHRADGLMAGLSPGQQELARRIFLRLIQPGEGTADTRRRAVLEEVLPPNAPPGPVEAIVQTLADANLLVTNRQPETGRVVLDVAHEALVQGWPRLRRWIDADREALRAHRRLGERAQEWVALERDEGGLLRGAQLIEAEAWARAHGAAMNAVEQEFLEASLALREREAAARAAQRQQELEAAQARARAEEQSRSASRLRWLAGLLAVAVLLAGLLTVFAINARSAAEAESRRANIAEATAQADRSEALALGTTEAQARQTAAAERDLARLAEQTAVAAEATSSYNAGVAATAQARELQAEQLARVSIRSEQLAAESRLASGDLPILLAIEAISVTQAAGLPPLPAAQQALIDALAGGGGRLPCYELRAGSGGTYARALTFSPDSVWLIWAARSDIRRWPVQPAPTRRCGERLAGEVIVAADFARTDASAVFSAGGRWLAATGEDEAVARVWALDEIAEAGQTPLRFGLQLQRVDEAVLALSADGRWLATHAGREPTLRLWDLTQETPTPFTTPAHDDGIMGAAFSLEGRWLATVDRRGSIHLWDLVQQQQGEPAFVFDGGSNSAALAFSPDGRWLAAGDRLWPLDLDGAGPAAAIELPGHSQRVDAVAFSPDSRWLVTAGLSDGSPQKISTHLWDLTASDPTAEPLILPHRDYSGSQPSINVRAAAFSPDGRWLATAVQNPGILIIWPLQTEDLLALSCLAVERNLTAAEWARYFPGEPRRPTCPGRLADSD